MPTPSSNQPSQPPSPQGFSSCPDDIQSPPRLGWQMGRDDETSDQHDTDMTRSDDPHTGLAVEHPPRRIESGPEDSLLAEERTTIEPSSRATTMSPQPQSSVTSGTSPESANSDPDMNKRASADIPAHFLNQAATDATMADHGSSVDRRTPEEATSDASSPPDASDLSLDDDLYAPSMGSYYPSMRVKSSPLSSYLRPGSKFHGTQQSERQVYEVSVEIKHVDMRESFLCGYLRIQGLTEDHPTLTTYFEGEIIGSKYNFFTKHDDWGANHKVDLSHWSKFSAFRPFQKHARQGHVTIDDVCQREHVFMRWKEHFLVPDHRVRTISGASFEGFYYICFNQVKGEVSGIYFHSKSEKFQQLELKHVPDRGCFSAMEFR